MRGADWAFRQANYSLREIAKELNLSKTVIWKYSKAPEQYDQKITMEDPVSQMTFSEFVN